MSIRIHALIGFACLKMLAQPSAPASPEPPPWPGEGALPKALQGQYVFVSPQRDALIVRVPPDSPYARSGKPGVIRYELHNRLNPTVTARLSVGQGGSYVYEYTVANAASASDSIGAWDLIVPANQEEPKRSCGEWCGGLSFPPIFRQVEMPDQPKGRVVAWIPGNHGGPIAPSRSQQGFRIESSCRPGFTTALFSSGILVSLDQELPDQVFKQLDFYNDPAWGKIPVLTFGPMFCAGSSRQAIAENMASGIKRLIETKALDSESQFVRDVLARLNSQIEENPPIRHSPSGEMEIVIAKALELNLSFKIDAKNKVE